MPAGRKHAESKPTSRALRTAAGESSVPQPPTADVPAAREPTAVAAASAGEPVAVGPASAVEAPPSGRSADAGEESAAGASAAPSVSSGRDPEDDKLLTLARSARARTAAPEGAAVRDADGRTYSAATVDLPSLRLSALRAAVVLAVASGARSLEAAAVVTDLDAPTDLDLAAVLDLGAPDTPVYLAGPDRAVFAVRAAVG
jgi:hypothetical protein